MIRNTEIDIHGEELNVKYMIENCVVIWITPIIKGRHYVGDWLLEIDSVREALEAHHANLLEEENIDV